MSDSKSQSDHINIRVAGPDGGEVFFKIKRSTQLKKLMEAYCEKQAIAPESIRFLYDGQRIVAEQTPASLDMNQDDIIDAVLQQTGGQ